MYIQRSPIRLYRWDSPSINSDIGSVISRLKMAFSYLSTSKCPGSLNSQHRTQRGFPVSLPLVCVGRGRTCIWHGRRVAYESKLVARRIEFGEGVSEPGGLER